MALREGWASSKECCCSGESVMALLDGAAGRTGLLDGSS
jgi:hypothetical protein